MNLDYFKRSDFLMKHTRMSYCSFVQTCSGGENAQLLKKNVKHNDMKLSASMKHNGFVFLFGLTTLLLTVVGGYAQIHQPVKWHFMVTSKPDQEAVLTITASLE